MTMQRFPLASLAFAMTAAVGTVHAQSLTELFDAARATDATYQSAKALFDANLAKADQAKAGILPTAGLAAGLNRNFLNNTPSADRAYTTQTLGVSASQPLYRPANWVTYAQGKKSMDLAQAQLTVAEQDLVIRVAQAYFDVLAANDTLVFVRAQKTAVAEQLASAKRNFEVGTSTITDTREAQARFDLVRAQEIAADNDVQVKKVALDTLVSKVNAQPTPLALPVVLPKLQADDVNTWVQQAQASHPGIQQAQIALDVARLETEKAKAGNKPTLDLTAGYGITRSPNGTSSSSISARTNATSVGLSLNLPLFAGYSIQNRIRETLSLEDKAQADLDAAQRSVTQATRTAFYGVLSGLGQVQALEAAESSSQIALDANKLGYQVGVRINIDVLNSQSQLFQTKRDLAQARYSVLLGGLKLRQASGSLKPEDLQAVNALLAR